MIQRYTFGTQKPDRDSERGEYVLFAEHERVTADLVAACRAVLAEFAYHNPAGTTKPQGRALAQARAAIKAAGE